MSKRQPARRPASNQRRNKSQAQRRGPTPSQRATRLLEGIHEDLRAGDPLQAELAAGFAVVESYDGYWNALERGEAEPARPAVAVLRLLAELREPRQRDTGLALAAALVALDGRDPGVAEQADATGEKLRFLGGKEPGWVGAEPHVVLVDVRVLRDVFGDELTIFIGAQHPGFEAHTVAATIMQTSTVDLVEVSVGGPIDEVEQNVRGSLATEPDAADMMRFEPIDPVLAGTLIWDALDSTEETMGVELDIESLECLALLESRWELLEPGVAAAQADGTTLAPVTHPTELDELGSAMIAARFTESPEFTGTDSADREMAAMLADWAGTQVAGGVARISPLVAEMFFHDLREASQPIDAAVTATLNAWIDYCGRLTELPQDAIDAIHEVATQLAVAPPADA